MNTIMAATGFLTGYIVPFILVLSLLVFVHEMGHYLVGRWCGIRSTAFSIGFGPELIGFTDKRGTRWKLAFRPNHSGKSDAFPFHPLNRVALFSMQRVQINRVRETTARSQNYP